MAKINPLGGNGLAFMNTSACIKENIWYKVVAKISDDEITAELHDINSTLLESVATTDGATNVNELLILIANNTDRALAFKNLNVETLNQPTQLPEGDKKAAAGIELLAPYVTFTILLAIIFAAVFYAKKRKKQVITKHQYPCSIINF
jgi:hypothetical protein